MGVFVWKHMVCLVYSVASENTHVLLAESTLMSSSAMLSLFGLLRGEFLHCAHSYGVLTQLCQMFALEGVSTVS